MRVVTCFGLTFVLGDRPPVIAVVDGLLAMVIRGNRRGIS